MMRIKTLYFSSLITDICLLFTYNASAQESYKVDVKHVTLYEKLTKEEIVEKFGEPDNYYISDDENLAAVVEIYEYGENALLFMDHEFEGFEIRDQRWSVMNDCFCGGLKVGDNISVFHDKGQLKLLKHERMADTFWILDNPLPGNAPDTYVMITTSDGIITAISYWPNP